MNAYYSGEGGLVVLQPLLTHDWNLIGLHFPLFLYLYYCSEITIECVCAWEVQWQVTWLCMPWFKDLNAAIKRDHHVMPTLEKRLPKLISHAEIVSIVNAKYGYLQPHPVKYNFQWCLNMANQKKSMKPA